MRFRTTVFRQTSFKVLLIVCVWFFAIPEHVRCTMAQEPLDHFGDDDRAMSPRSWSVSRNSNQKLPEVSFGKKSMELNGDDDSTPFRQVESSKIRNPKQFYETKPLQEEQGPQKPSPIESAVPNSVLESQDSYPLQRSQPSDTSNKPENRTRDDTNQDFESTLYGQSYLNQSCDTDDWILTDDIVRLAPKYSAEYGHRYVYPLERGFTPSSTTKFSFEEDGDFPPASEILAQSVFFSEFELLFLQPSFQDNTAVSVSDGSGITANPFNFDMEPAFRFQAGFESEYGPGFAAEYFQFDNDSDSFVFISDGVAQGETAVNFLGGALAGSALSADNNGERLVASHSLELHSTSVFAFKAIKFKRAYVNGRFGVQIVSIDQVLESGLFDAMDNRIGQLNHSSNLNAFGPRFGIDYVRKIGHTPAQLIASSTSSILFGDRDQIIENSLTNESFSLGSDEFVTVFDIFLGVQGKRIRGEKRNFVYRVGFVNQSWIGAGSALSPSSNLGFQGISLMFGFNR